MKTSRMIGIITVLLNQNKTTLNELGDKFEVSKRTIQRDIERLCIAGIPIITLPGSGGGISIAENYILKKNMLTKDEILNILAGLGSITSISKDSTMSSVNEKLIWTVDENDIKSAISINLASYYKDSLEDKIAALKQAIADMHQVSFDYYSASGEGRKTVLPYKIIFQWESWYLWGREVKKVTPKLYKLNRLWNLLKEHTSFTKDEVVPYEKSVYDYYNSGFDVLIKFDHKVKWRIIEAYGPSSFTNSNDGYIMFKRKFENKDFLMSWLLSFGSYAELLEPKDLVEDIKKEISRLCETYKKVDS